MIYITVSNKTTNMPVEIINISDKKYEDVINKCKEYNKELDRSLYCSKVSTKSSGINRSYFLDFEVKSLKPVRLRGKKHSVLGSNAFNCDYVVPMEI